MQDTVAFYQQKIKQFITYPRTGALNYVTLGLAGEVGEVANQVKKVIRDDAGVLTPDRLGKLHNELGDVCWYLGMVCNELGFELADVMMQNINKLSKRKADGTIQGDKRNEPTV